LVQPLDQIFDNVFGKKHLSIKCLARSALFSLIAVCIVFLVVLPSFKTLPNIEQRWAEKLEESLLDEEKKGLTEEEIRTFDEWKASQKTLAKPYAMLRVFIFALLINLLVDYISLMETRCIIRAMSLVRGFPNLFFYFLGDLLLSGFIVSTLFSAVIAYGPSPAEFLVDKEILESYRTYLRSEFDDALSEASSSDASTLQDSREDTVSQNADDSRRQIYSFVFITIGFFSLQIAAVCFCSTFWTTAILFLYMLGVWTIWGLGRAHALRSLALDRFRLAEKPFVCLGGVASFLAFLITFYIQL